MRPMILVLALFGTAPAVSDAHPGPGDEPVARVPVTPPAPLAPTVQSSPAVQSTELKRDSLELLRFVPDNSLTVVYLPSINEFVAGLREFGAAIGIPPLAELTAEELLRGPFDDNARYVDPASGLVAAFTGDSEPILIVSLRHDPSHPRPEGVIQLANGAKGTEVGGQAIFATADDRTALLAVDREQLNRGLTSTGKLAARFRQRTGEFLTGSQAVLYVDIAASRPDIERLLILVQAAMAASMVAAGPDAETGVQFWNWMYGHVRTWLSEAQDYSAGARFSGEGVAYRDRFAVAPDGEIGAYLKRVQKSDRNLLRGLPDQDCWFVFASEWRLPKDLKSVNEMMSVALGFDDATLAELGPERMAELRRLTHETYQLVSGTSAVGSFAADGRGMLMSGFYFVDQPAVARRNIRDLILAAPTMQLGVGGKGPLNSECKSETQGDRTFDRCIFRFSGNDPQIGRMMEALYGGDPVLLLGDGKESVAYAVGSSEAVQKPFDLLLSADVRPLAANPRVVTALKRVEPAPDAILLMDLTQVVRFAATVSATAGVPMPTVTLPQGESDLAVFSTYLQPSSVSNCVFVPSDSLRRIIGAFRATRMPPPPPPPRR